MTISIRHVFTVSLCCILCTFTQSVNAKKIQPPEFSLYAYGAEIIDENNAATPSNNKLHITEQDHFHVQNHYLFEQGESRIIEGRFRYFMSDRMQLTNNYGGTFINGDAEGFHTMLRMTMKF